MRRALLIAIAGLLLGATPAKASAPVAWQRKAIAQAERTWHPTCGHLAISFESAPPVAGAELWGGWAYAGECIVHLPAARFWVMGYPEFCQVVLHEAGHIAGMAHAATGVMRAETFIVKSTARINGHSVTVWSGVDRRCLPPH